MEESKSLLSRASSSPDFSAPKTPLPTRIALALLTTLLTASLILNIHLLAPTGSTETPLAPTGPTEPVWSPVHASVPARVVRFNETYHYPTRYPSIYAGNSSAADAAWARFVDDPMINGHRGTVAVTEAELRRYLGPWYGGEWAASAVEIPAPAAERYGEKPGQKMYMASLDIFHLMHCLSFFRATIYPTTTTAHLLADAHFAPHQEHCLQALREALMCRAGDGVTVYHWMRDQARPYPDYNTYHVCRDPEEMLEWARARAVAVEGWLRKPDGVVGAGDPYSWGEE